MRICYDTEFVCNGRTIDLISIGVVAENGDEYYAVVADDLTIDRAANDQWLADNVLPSLPVSLTRDRSVVTLNADGLSVHPVTWWDWDSEHADFRHVKPRRLIAREVKEFILSFTGPELWAWYAAYDHVALCELWGRMIDLPKGIPMHTNDLKQECDRLGNPRVPKQKGGAHNALADARYDWEIARFLDQVRATTSYVGLLYRGDN